MLTRRTQESITPKKLIEEVAFAPLDWPGKTVRLEPSAVESYCQRSTSGRISIAELYHENSKLFPAMMAYVTAVRVDHVQVRHEFLRRRAESRAEDKTVQFGGELINAGIQSELFYAIELRFLQGGVLASYEPVSKQFHLTKRLSDEEVARLNDAIHLNSGEGRPRRAAPTNESSVAQFPLIFVIGNFARNDLLYGARGYRRTLIEAGRVIEALREIAGESPRVSLEFADRAVDSILECDGVEEGTLAVIEPGLER